MVFSVSLSYLFVLLIVFGHAEQLRLMQYNIFDLVHNDPQSAQTSQQIFQWLNWHQNDQIIKNINQKANGTYRVQHNRFSYLSLPQIQSIYLTLKVNIPTNVVVSTPQSNNVINFAPTQFIYAFNSNNGGGNVPQPQVTNIDWRNRGAVTPVKDQGNCGSCWAFSATAQVQSHLLMNYNTNVSLSQQQLIDCSWSYGNLGCSGGMMANAFKYILSNGITLQYLYPYKQSTSTCQYNRATMQSFSISTTKILYNDCSALKTLLETKPTTVVVSADMSFIFYSSGILNTCGQDINHSIQLVGFYQDQSNAYYIGKNSWGVSWGQNGFVNIDANVNNGNLCHVCTYPQYIE